MGVILFSKFSVQSFVRAQAPMPRTMHYKLTNAKIGFLQASCGTGPMIFPLRFGKSARTVVQLPVYENGQTDKFYIENDIAMGHSC